MKKLFCLLFLAPLYINATPLDPLAEESKINSTPALSYARYEQLNAFLKEKLDPITTSEEAYQALNCGEKAKQSTQHFSALSDQVLPLFHHMVRALRLSTGLIEDKDQSDQIGWRIKKQVHTEKAARIQAVIAQKSAEHAQKEAEKKAALEENAQKNQAINTQKERYLETYNQTVASLSTQLEKDTRAKTVAFEAKQAALEKAFEATKKTNKDNTDMLEAITQTHTKQQQTLQETHEADLAALQEETTTSITELTENKDAELQRQEAEKTTQAAAFEDQLSAIDAEISTLTAERDRLTALKTFWEGYYKNPDHNLNFQRTESWTSWVDQNTGGLAKRVISTDPFYWAIPLAPKSKATTAAAPGAEDDDAEESAPSLTPEQLEQERITQEVFALLGSGKVMLFPFQSLLKEDGSLALPFFTDEHNQNEAQILKGIQENMFSLAKIAHKLKKKSKAKKTK